MLLDSPHPSAIVQLPMVLGEGDYAAYAINQQATKRLNVVFAKNARDQPIYAGDVIDAITALLPTESNSPINDRLILAGPESVNKKQLLQRAAALRGRKTTVIGLPLLIAQLFTQLVGKLSNNPPITPAMLEILHHDDCFDATRTCETLGLTRTSLDDMLERVRTP